MKRHILYISMILIVAMSSCRDDFGDENTPPDKVSNPDPVRLFAEALVTMDNDAYVEWFYNYSYYLKWSQATVSEGGNQSDINLVRDYYSSQHKLLIPKLQIEQIRYLLREKYSETEAAKYQYLDAICNPILVYLGLHGTDMYGSMSYTEASTAPYTSPSNITPCYQTQQELFEVWLDELDKTIAVLTTEENATEQVSPGTQDFLYNGDWAKWAKFTNSLKLKIAVRMLGFNQSKALEIAKEVATSPAGIMSSIDDDPIYRASGNYYFRFNEPVENAGIGSHGLINFLRENLDPRLRFLFAKNDFNASVVQAFFDSGREVPSYILDLVEYTESGGKKSFIGWKIPGEPWVRYHGAPVDIQARKDAAINNAYFNKENFRLASGGGTKTYQPLSLYNEEMVRGNAVYTYPAPPDAPTIQDNTFRYWYGAFYSSAEVNLYLAEFSLLGAVLSESAEDYYNRGVELSVRLMDKLASLNGIPYYEYQGGFDATDKTIALKEEEVSSLVQHYSLSGSNSQKLEQVYLQQYIHHLYLPQELLVTVRRSGYPGTRSSLLQWEPFNSAQLSYPIPRRLPVPVLNPLDGMFKIKQAAYQAEGFTAGTNSPGILQSQRVDYDKNAPDYGAGNH